MGKQINIFDFIEEAEKSNTYKVIEFRRRGMDYEPLYDGEIGNHRERTRNLKGWNKSSILKLINETFNCSFTELILK